MGRTHQRGEMEPSLFLQQSINGLGALPGVDDAKNLLAGVQLPGQVFPGQGALPMVNRPAKDFVPHGLRRTQFFAYAAEFLENGA